MVFLHNHLLFHKHIYQNSTFKESFHHNKLQHDSRHRSEIRSTDVIVMDYWHMGVTVFGKTITKLSYCHE